MAERSADLRDRATGQIVSSEIERVQRYLEALENARRAIEDARRLYPDFRLDHAVDRLRGMVSQGSLHLAELLGADADSSHGA
jgi:hypothetical protein